MPDLLQFTPHILVLHLALPAPTIVTLPKPRHLVLHSRAHLRDLTYYGPIRRKSLVLTASTMPSMAKFKAIDLLQPVNSCHRVSSCAHAGKTAHLYLFQDLTN
ncbi:hypothetical protein K1T71_000081 [Dendrolimus kikuchii]|uniref:Uncharacterized protein n=1 Tax=Dendrolimus kikuchii TaxID=765133 RepID=A0ACC1DJ24_9NEOP|nr:hypothetical protein K1T71_000081 [Dendrolimus kikuchii]